MVLGVYYLTMQPTRPEKGDGRAFANIDEVILAYQLGQVSLHARIKLMVESWYSNSEKPERLSAPEKYLLDTTVGRAIFNDILPEEIRFINKTLEKGGIRDLIAEIHEVLKDDATTDVADKIKDIGFRYATQSGATLAVADIEVAARESGHY